MKQIHAVFATLALVLLLLQGCSSGVTRTDEEPVDQTDMGVTDGADMGQDDQMTQTATADMGGMFEGRPIQEVLSDPDTPLSKRVFYFDFNSSDLTYEDREALAYHARFMNEVPNVTVVLEGHADERGSREYNLALGERRAQTIERILTLAGVTQEQIQVISFGEERPVALGHDEGAWSLNRRVELLYSGY